MAQERSAVVLVIIVIIPALLHHQLRDQSEKYTIHLDNNNTDDVLLTPAEIQICTGLLAICLTISGYYK